MGSAQTQPVDVQKRDSARRARPGAKLLENTPSLKRLPRLPRRKNARWHPRAVDWWRRLRQGPAIRMFTALDVDQLLAHVGLIDRLWTLQDAIDECARAGDWNSLKGLSGAATSLQRAIRESARELNLTPLARSQQGWLTEAEAQSRYNARAQNLHDAGRNPGTGQPRTTPDPPAPGPAKPTPIREVKRNYDTPTARKFRRPD